MKHTEGKWRLTDTFGGKQEFVISDNKDIAKVLSGNIEDARLIASAPELLEALKSTRILHLENYEEGTIGKKLYIEIEQAIAKAEGK